MRKQMLAKVRETEAFLKSGNREDKEKYLAYLTRWIGYFQHERFVHLMVTLFFALFSIMMAFGYLALQLMPLLALFVLFAVTTGFYVEHYFLLENKTQYLYELYDKIEMM